jgi:soluble lytic murein transglycosylase-like protein
VTQLNATIYGATRRAPVAPRGGVPGWRRMLFILTAVALLVPLFLHVKPAPGSNSAALPAAQNDDANASSPVRDTGAAAGAALVAPAGAIAAIFAPPVQYWAPQILEWAAARNLDPNLAATIMQVESCGDPGAVSSAGARGLFQVMPFHFAAGEDAMDPDTNARRGLDYFVARLQQTGGDVGRAFAGYNGGHVAAGTSWDQWLPETQRYYVWTTGIYEDIQQGRQPSPTLDKWMQAGGASLCRQAASRLGLTP